MKTIEDIKTYGDAADFINECDYYDYPIFVRIDKDKIVEVNNHDMFSETIKHNPDSKYPFKFKEEDGKYFID